MTASDGIDLRDRSKDRPAKQSGAVTMRLRSSLRRLGGLGKVPRAVNRRFFPHLFSGLAGYHVVCEYPKSGGTWVSQLLADALGLPFPQHRGLGLSPAIVHGHFSSPFGFRRTLVLWRDPRDVFVSFYYHCYFENEHENFRLVPLMKEYLPFRDYDDIQSNLPTFIRTLSEKPLAPKFTWAQFAERWVDTPRFSHARYEEFRHDGPETLIRVVREMTGTDLDAGKAAQICERHSFDRAKARAQQQIEKRAAGPASAVDGTGRGIKMSFVRAGSTGGWRAHFTDEAEAMAERYWRPIMDRLGYE